MTDDIVARLRIFAEFDPDQAEAADEIERLRDALQRANATAEGYERKFYLGSDRIEALETALQEMLEIVATHRVYVGNSPAGELACEWTMDAIKEIHAKMEEALDRVALEGEKKDG